MSKIVRVSPALDAQINLKPPIKEELVVVKKHKVISTPILEDVTAVAQSGVMLAMLFPIISVPAALLAGFGIYKVFSKKETVKSHDSQS